MTRFQREQELINSGLVDSIKMQYQNVPHNIPDKYFILIADYIDSIGQLDYESGLYLNPIEVAKSLPKLLRSVNETNLGGIHGITNGDRIEMNLNLDYEANKLYFFHELTHALQTRNIENREECSFYNGKTGMFLTEGATQFTAEILYHISNGTNLHYRQQPNTVRGHSEHTPYSPLSEYQLNGNILMLLSFSLGVPINQLLALGFRKDGRQLLKDMYEVFPNNAGKFEEFMLNLEKIYSIDKLIIMGKGNQLQNNLVNIRMQNGITFSGNIASQGDLINKIERDLAANFIEYNNTEYIIQNYNKILLYLTTPELKQNFKNVINEILTYQNNQGTIQSSQRMRR